MKQLCLFLLFALTVQAFAEEHLAEDPSETKNLAESNPEKVAELRKRLDAWWNPAK
jgi:hypothetical protein